jgi:hypothetical protein
MLDLLKLLFDWPAMVERGADAVSYAVMALVGTLLFVIRLAMALFGGDAGDGADADIDVGDSDAAFSLFSVLSILAFFMGAGWMGLACRLDWDLGRLVSAIVSAGFGFVMMLAAAGLSWGARRLNREVAYDVATAVGHTGRVYLTVPAKGVGTGQVEISVSGRKKVLRAESTGGKIAAFQDVVVVEVRDDGTLIVEPLH